MQRQEHEERGTHVQSRIQILIERGGTKKKKIPPGVVRMVAGKREDGKTKVVLEWEVSCRIKTSEGGPLRTEPTTEHPKSRQTAFGRKVLNQQGGSKQASGTGTKRKKRKPVARKSLSPSTTRYGTTSKKKRALPRSTKKERGKNRT